MTMQQILYYCTEGDPAVITFRNHGEVMSYARSYRAKLAAEQAKDGQK